MTVFPEPLGYTSQFRLPEKEFNSIYGNQPVVGSVVPVKVLDNKLEHFDDIVNRYEINPMTSEKLFMLNDFDVVIIADDSGSMQTSNDKGITRWEELKNFCSLCVEICSCMNSNGTDIYFLNRPTVYNVKSKNQISQIFEQKPNGGTPLNLALSRVYDEKVNSKKLMILIATDGEPNDYGDKSIMRFRELLKQKKENVYINILACTDDEHAIGYLNKIDVEIPRIDVIDDYESEKNQVINVYKKKKLNLPFSYGDYVVKTMIGSIDISIDRQDEHEHEISNGGCGCSIM